MGMASLFPMDELSVMGIAEVLPKYPELRRRLHEAAADCIAFQPDALITIDSPDFSLRLARLVKASGEMRTIHYVAPSVWAWRPGRAAKMAQHVDHVLALLPFEPPLMQAAGMTCDFVGHPVVAEPVATEVEARAFRDEFDEAQELLTDQNEAMGAERPRRPQRSSPPQVRPPFPRTRRVPSHSSRGLSEGTSDTPGSR